MDKSAQIYSDSGQHIMELILECKAPKTPEQETLLNNRKDRT